EVTGNGFLYNMVRIMVGTLYYVGIGKIDAEEIPEILLSGDRKRAGKTMPPEGLDLKEVKYAFDED
ncbi:MAG: tRNA pseudouridine(38-40) synthase TruA, partial [Clostridia bacterium]|nr:tRNA pseudouridine(38-40) synthase TruA [Clostridia bacterium]